MKRMKAFVAALLLSVSSLMMLNIGQALAATCTWTGASSDNLNTAGNWSNCGSGVPQAGDNITFDNTSLSVDKILNNNITSLSVATITFSGTGSHTFTLTGNSITTTAGIVANANATIDLGLALGGNQTWSGTGSYLNIGTYAAPRTVALSTYNLSITHPSIFASAVLTGSGNLTASKDLTLGSSSPAWTGTTTITSTGNVNVSKVDSLGTTNAVTIADGGGLNFCGPAGGTVQNAITVGGNHGGAGALASFVSCGSGGGSDTSAAKVVLSGAIALTANTLVAPSDEFKITGALSGAYTMSVKSGSTGKLVIASSNNTSGTPNGTIGAAAETITVDAGDNQPNASVLVGNNQTYVINGVRGTTNVLQGGTLKGTGTVGILMVNGHLAPGQSPGCLNSGDLTFDTNAVYDFEIAGTTVCTQYDQMKVTGTVTIAGGSIALSLLNNFKPVQGQVYVLVDNDGTDAVSGTFPSLAEGATFTANGVVYKISYVGGSGNDITLTVMNVPATPDTGFAMVKSNPLVSVAAMAMAAAGIVVLSRRSKKTVTRRR